MMQFIVIIEHAASLNVVLYDKVCGQTNTAETCQTKENYPIFSMFPEQ